MDSQYTTIMGMEVDLDGSQEKSKHFSSRRLGFVAITTVTVLLLLIATWHSSSPVSGKDWEEDTSTLSKKMLVAKSASQIAIESKAASLTPRLVLQMMFTVYSLMKHYAAGGLKVTDIKIPTEAAHIVKKRIYNGIMIASRLEDEMMDGAAAVGANAAVEQQGITGSLYPTTNDYFTSVAESRTWIGTALGPTFRTDGEFAEWVEMAADNAMRRWAFFGLGSHITRKVRRSDLKKFGLLPKWRRRRRRKNMVYISDATKLSLYPVRAGFVRFGAAAFFNKKKNIRAIYVSYLDKVVRKGDKDWEHAKFVWKSSLMTQVTMEDHFSHTHFVEANTLSLACREVLPPDHPLRRFLKAHIYRTDVINRNAIPGGIGYGTLFHATWSFSFDGLYTMMTDLLGTYKYRPFIQRIQENGMSKERDTDYPLLDAIPYWKVVEKYVKQYLDIYYPQGTAQLRADPHAKAFWERLVLGLNMSPHEKLTKGSLDEVLTQLIFAVSSLHEMYGTVVPICNRVNGYATKLRAGQTQADIQAFAAVASLAVTLSGDYPLIGDDYSHLFLKDGKLGAVMKNFKRFQGDLKKLSADVTAKNKNREYPFLYFDPQYIECSVSF